MNYFDKRGVGTQISVSRYVINDNSFKHFQTNAVLLFRFKDFKLSQLQNIRRMVFPLSDLGDIEEDANKQNSEKVTTTKGRFLHDINSVRLWGILCSIPLYPYPRQAAHRTSYEVSMTNRNSWRQLCGEPIAQPPPNPEMCVRADHSTGNYVPYSFR